MGAPATHRQPRRGGPYKHSRAACAPVLALHGIGSSARWLAHKREVVRVANPSQAGRLPLGEVLFETLDLRSGDVQRAVAGPHAEAAMLVPLAEQHGRGCHRGKVDEGESLVLAAAEGARQVGKVVEAVKAAAVELVEQVPRGQAPRKVPDHQGGGPLLLLGGGSAGCLPSCGAGGKLLAEGGKALRRRRIATLCGDLRLPPGLGQQVLLGSDSGHRRLLTPRGRPRRTLERQRRGGAPAGLRMRRERGHHAQWQWRWMSQRPRGGSARESPASARRGQTTRRNSAAPGTHACTITELVLRVRQHLVRPAAGASAAADHHAVNFAAAVAVVTALDVGRQVLVCVRPCRLRLADLGVVEIAVVVENLLAVG
mmetsp:Transcript_65345/g.204760  ORF Transcript_65345/g.204760 Transcript_65345/m.204760 type:complete len:370 (+) Transcript_65345:1-1110(+)